MSNPDKYDVVIIGAGPGGYVAGIRASQLGLRACIVEKENPGGICLNWGCIPSKNLIHQATMLLAKSDLEDIGVTIDTKKLDYGRVQNKSREAVRLLRSGVSFLLKKNKVTLINGTARIQSPGSVILQDGTTIDANHIIIATGSRPMMIPEFEFDEKRVLSSTGILSMKDLPKKLIILGGGAIGCEFAYIMNAFGVDVTIVEMESHLLPFEDEEIVKILEKSYKASGINVLCQTRAVSLENKSDLVRVGLENNDGNTITLDADKVLCVFGRTPNTDDIGLENVGIKTERGYIPVKDYGQTVIDGIYAIGDVVASPLLAHVASKEGEIAVEHIARKSPSPKIDLNLVPSAIYCEPQVASFGLREVQAKREGIQHKTARFPYRGVGKAVAINKPEGLVKVLFDPESNEILGAHIIGQDATELLHEILLAKSAELLPEDIAHMIHAHPTLSELVHEVMKSTKGEAIHI